MPYKAATFAEIETKLRQDFARRLKDSGHPSAEINDPVLRILFRTFASQLEALYFDTERVKESLLDELIGGLGMERRMPRPAQTIVRFYEPSGYSVIPAGSELMGTAQSGEKLTFTTDATLAVSSARIALAATYQNGGLQLMAGMELPDHFQSAYPSHDPVPADLGPHPAIVIAVENLPAGYLSQHGFFFDISAPDVQNALFTESWRLSGSDGRFGAAGILRPYRRNAGVQSLVWIADEGLHDGSNGDRSGQPELPNGFYAGRVFVFPATAGSSPKAPFLCRMPVGMEGPLSRIFRGAGGLFQEPRVWLKIAFSPQISDLHTGVHSVALHAISASNVFDLNQTIEFETQGTSVPVSQADRYLVAPLAITGGEDNAAYIPASQCSSEVNVGRFSIRNGRIDLIPAQRAGVRPIGKANIPVWATNGELGNTVAPGQLQSFARSSAPEFRIGNPMPAAGGTNGEGFREAQRRFEEVLLSRSRIVTAADLQATVKAFDRRIDAVEVSAALQRTARGLQRVQRITVVLNQDGFHDLREESRILREDLERHLRKRIPYDIVLAVDTRWTNGQETEASH
jgi:hypothetical protein